MFLLFLNSLEKESLVVLTIHTKLVIKAWVLRLSVLLLTIVNYATINFFQPNLFDDLNFNCLILFHEKSRSSNQTAIILSLKKKVCSDFSIDKWLLCFTLVYMPSSVQSSWPSPYYQNMWTYHPYTL